MSNNHVSQTLFQLLQTTIKFEKSIRLASFQKSQLSSVSIFFKFVHPCLPVAVLYIPSLYVFSVLSGYFWSEPAVKHTTQGQFYFESYQKAEIRSYFVCSHTFFYRIQFQGIPIQLAEIQPTKIHSEVFVQSQSTICFFCFILDPTKYSCYDTSSGWRT